MINNSIILTDHEEGCDCPRCGFIRFRVTAPPGFIPEEEDDDDDDEEDAGRPAAASGPRTGFGL